VARLISPIESLAGSADPDDLRDAASFTKQVGRNFRAAETDRDMRIQIESIRGELREDLGVERLNRRDRHRATATLSKQSPL